MFNQLCVWQGTIVGEDKVDEFVKWMMDTFGVRVKYEVEVKTLPDMENGAPVPETGGRNDVFFYIHDDDVVKFAVPRLQYGIRWFEDVILNGGGALYSEEILDKYNSKDVPDSVPKADITVQITGDNGNAFVIMGKVTKALKRAGREDLVEQYKKDAMSGDYQHLLRVTMQYVNVE